MVDLRQVIPGVMQTPISTAADHSASLVRRRTITGLQVWKRGDKRP